MSVKERFLDSWLGVGGPARALSHKPWSEIPMGIFNGFFFFEGANYDIKAFLKDGGFWVVFFTILRFVFNRTINFVPEAMLEPLPPTPKNITDGTANAREKKSWEKTNQTHLTLCRKYRETLFKTLTKIVNITYGFYTIYPMEWFDDWGHKFGPWLCQAGAPWPTKVAPSTYSYYCFCFGFHGHVAIFQTLLDPVRTDFLVQFIHHWTTVSIMIVSYCGDLGGGAAILFITDFSDVALGTGKILLYSTNWREENKQFWKSCQDTHFVAIIITWVVTRLYVFPRMFFPIEDVWRTGLMFPRCTENPDCGIQIACLFCDGGNWVLLTLFVYWGYMISMVAVRKCIKGELQDIRSDNEDDDIPEEEPKKNN